MAVAERPTTWFEDITEGVGKFEPVLLECVGTELGRLAAARGRKSRLARVAIEIGSSFQSVPCGASRVDDEIASAAHSMKAKVATADRELARALDSMHIGVIGLRAGRVSIPG